MFLFRAKQSRGGRAAAVPLFSPTKEVRGLGRGTARWLWQLYVYRLTKAGRWFFWPTLSFIICTSMSLQRQSYVVLCYVAALWLVALSLAVLCKPRWRLKARHAGRVCAGEVLPVEISAEALGKKTLPALFVLPHRLPALIDAQNEEGVPMAVERSGRRGSATLGLQCGRRGIYPLHGFRAESDFPFGLVNAYSILAQESSLLVYPRFTPLARLEIPGGRCYQPGGVALASVVGDSAEFIGNRDFRMGDNVRDIDWRATARRDELIVREYREEYFMRVAVVLDTHVGPEAPAARGECFESAVSLAASVGDYLARHEYLVDIFAAGPNLYHLVAGRSLGYLDQILDILACVGESPSEPFAVLAPELMLQLSQIRTVICIFLDWNPARRQFVDSLRQQGVGLKVIVVSAEEIDLSGGPPGSRWVSRREAAAGVAEL
jgi:uncharacterized protein (DUF58 family)